MRSIEFQTRVENVHIEIPAEFKGQLAGNVHVIVREERKPTKPDFLDQLFANPIKLDRFTPLTREELYDR